MRKSRYTEEPIVDGQSVSSIGEVTVERLQAQNIPAT